MQLIKRVNNWLRHPIVTLKNAEKKTKTFFREKFYGLYYGNNIILLESHHEFGGNSGALFRYMQKKPQYSSYTYVWIIKDYIDGTFKNTRRVMVFSFNHKSYKKSYLIDHAKIAFFDDVPVRAGGRNAKTIYLTHGAGPKMKNVKGIINVPAFVNKALCTSGKFIKQKSDDYSFPAEKFFVCGLPRNDVLFEPAVDISKIVRTEGYRKRIIWMPTFRKARGTDRNDSSRVYPFGLQLFNSKEEIEVLQQELKQKDMLLVIKLHPLQDNSVFTIGSQENIVVLTHDELIQNGFDTNMLYPHFDAMISDYSSAPFDYMLLNRPLGYIVEDFDDYKLSIPLDDYNLLTPGTKIRSIQEFIQFIDDVSDGIDAFKAEREIICDYIYYYKDGENSKRIAELFLEG